MLVTAIPQKWCTAAALEGLYDVFPGGVRNIWINRNFDELNDKVQLRQNLARRLESAETNLIVKCKKAQMKTRRKEEKEHAQKLTKGEKAAQKKARDEEAAAFANTQGMSTNNPHQIHHTVDGELYGSEHSSKHSSRSGSRERIEKSPLDPLDVMNKGVGAVGKGVMGVGKGLTKVGQTIFGGIKDAGQDINSALETTQGFQADDTEQLRPSTSGRRASPEGIAPGYSVPHSRSSNEAERASGRSREEVVHHPGNAASAEGSPERSLRVHGAAGNETAITGSPDTRVEGSRSRPQTSDTQRPQTSDSKPPHTSDKHDFAEKLKIVKSPTAPQTIPLNPKTKFKFWRDDRNVLQVPSPMPHKYEGDEFPLQPMSSSKDATKTGSDGAEDEGVIKRVLTSTTSGGAVTKREDYSAAYDEAYDPEEGDPVWKKYIQQKDRETMRVPYRQWWWLSWLPFFGRKVDTIDFCRKEVARLNLEIEQDQSEPEKFPHMNSAFIQFNHQVAAHLACQAVSHHVPNYMTPRVVEIAPDDVVWDNMSIKWWERYLRTCLILIIVVGLVVGWAIPVAFTGLLSQVTSLAETYPHELGWMQRIPQSGLSLIQGILPPALLSLLLILLPLILRLLARAQGIVTGMLIELALSDYYFFFLFVQVFLVVTFASGITRVWSQLTSNITNVPAVLGDNLPKASNYFFSYLILQALSTSSAALLQLGALFMWFIWASLFDTTARDKWARQVTLPNVQWGTFFPYYTVFAIIGQSFSLRLVLLPTDVLRCRHHLLHHRPPYPSLQHHYLLRLLVRLPLHYALRYQIHPRHWRPPVSQGHQPALHGPLLHGTVPHRPLPCRFRRYA